MTIRAKERMREGHVRAGHRHVNAEIVDGSKYEHRRRHYEPDVSGTNELQAAIFFALRHRAEKPKLKWRYNCYNEENDRGQPLHHQEPMMPVVIPVMKRIMPA